MTGKTRGGWWGGGRAAKACAPHPAWADPCWSGRLAQQGPRTHPWPGAPRPQRDCDPGPSLAPPWLGVAPSNAPELGETDKCNKDRRNSWRDGHLTYQVALQEGCGGGEEERQKERMCERQPYGQSHSWGRGRAPGPVEPPAASLGGGSGPGLGCREAPSVPPSGLEGPAPKTGLLCPGRRPGVS